MHSDDVCFQVRSLIGTVPTLGTGIGALPRVDADVSGKVELFNETLPTKRASVSPLIGKT